MTLISKWLILNHMTHEIVMLFPIKLTTSFQSFPCTLCSVVFTVLREILWCALLLITTMTLPFYPVFSACLGVIWKPRKPFWIHGRPPDPTGLFGFCYKFNATIRHLSIFLHLLGANCLDVIFLTCIIDLVISILWDKFVACSYVGNNIYISDNHITNVSDCSLTLAAGVMIITIHVQYWFTKCTKDPFGPHHQPITKGLWHLTTHWHPKCLSSPNSGAWSFEPYLDISGHIGLDGPMPSAHWRLKDKGAHEISHECDTFNPFLSTCVLNRLWSYKET